MSASPPPPILPDMNSGPRNYITTDQDHGGIALVMCTLMATWVVLSLLLRMYMRATISGPFGIDDAFCGIATIFGVIQMIVSSAAVSFGFGKTLELLTETQIVKASKAIYAAQLLYIVTNALTKCTVALLLARIVFIKSRVQACYGLMVVSCLWGIGSFIAEAVRCSEHAPWQTVGAAQCSNLMLAWDAITAFNILIECALLAFPIWLVWPLQTSFGKKVTVVAVFWLRLPVIVAAGVRLYFLRQTIGSGQPLFNGVIPFTLLNVEMHYGLMAATMPTLKPFVRAFNTAWGTYDTQGISGYGQGSSGSYAMHSLGRGSDRKGSTPLSGTQISSRSERESQMQKYGKNVSHVRASKVLDPERTHSNVSTSSQQMIIRHTVETEIHYEEDEVRRRETFLAPESPGVGEVHSYHKM